MRNAKCRHMRNVPDMKAVHLHAKCVMMRDLRQYFRRGPTLPSRFFKRRF